MEALTFNNYKNKKFSENQPEKKQSYYGNRSVAFSGWFSENLCLFRKYTPARQVYIYVYTCIYI